VRDEPLPLNCPKCGSPLRAEVSAETYVYVCSVHGRFFIAAEDGRLYDVPATKH